MSVVYADNIVPLRGDPLGQVWWQGRQWAVTSDGLEARDGCYCISADRLAEDLPAYSWPEHMAGKAWVDMADFVTAWLVALTLYGITDTVSAELRNAARLGLKRSAAAERAG